MSESTTIKAEFRHTTNHGEEIKEFALPVIAVHGPEVFASGTAIVVAQGLAITAKHVLEDFAAKYVQKYPQEDPEDLPFHIFFHQVREGGKTEALWQCLYMWKCQLSDIVFLAFQPYSNHDQDYRWKSPVISLFPPPIGTGIMAFGYHEIEGPSGKKYVSSTATGTVAEIHERRRDSSMLPFPCFRTNARFDGGMSGGPVFRMDNGQLCGIVCTNLPPSEEEEGEVQHTSYVTTLWPAMATMISVPREGQPPEEVYPVLHLARDGYLEAPDWQRIELEQDDEGKYCGIRVF